VQNPARVGLDLDGAVGDELGEAADAGGGGVGLGEAADPLGNRLDGAGREGGAGAALERASACWRPRATSSRVGRSRWPTRMRTFWRGASLSATASKPETKR
jgi:hypothetical protein